jgi:hypothetical protein
MKRIEENKETEEDYMAIIYKTEGGGKMKKIKKGTIIQ